MRRTRGPLTDLDRAAVDDFRRFLSGELGYDRVEHRYVDPADAKTNPNVAVLSVGRCTGLTATWCPLHGDCTCPVREEGIDAGEGRTLNDPGCPLHAPDSLHAVEPPTTD